MPQTFVTVASRRFKFGYPLKNNSHASYGRPGKPLWDQAAHEIGGRLETVSIAYSYLMGRASLLLGRDDKKITCQ